MQSNKCLQLFYFYISSNQNVFLIHWNVTKNYNVSFQAPAAKLIYLFAIQRKKDVQMVDSVLKLLGMTSFASAHQVSLIFLMAVYAALYSIVT